MLCLKAITQQVAVRIEQPVSSTIACWTALYASVGQSMVADCFAGMRRFCESPEMCLGRLPFDPKMALLSFSSQTHI
jgi:hypothetical protein